MLERIGFTYNSLDFMIRIVTACVCGAVIGAERTHRLKEAGVRTHTIVALASALMMVLSKYAFSDVTVHGGSYDVSRIAASVVTGVSFLGTGVIYVRGITTRGLTTAAGIWAVSGIGMALGAGMYVVGVASTALLFAVQLLLHRFVGGLDSFSLSEISITVRQGSLEKLKPLLEEHGVIVQKCSSIASNGDTVTMHLTVRSGSDLTFDTAADIFSRHDDIVSFSVLQ